MDDMEFDKSILGYEDEFKFDGNLNAKSYIHYALISSMKVLVASSLKGTLKDNIQAYALLINQVENYVRAGDYIDEVEYDKKIFEYVSSDEYKKLPELIQIARLSDKKHLLLSKNIFKHSTLYNPLKL